MHVRGTRTRALRSSHLGLASPDIHSPLLSPLSHKRFTVHSPAAPLLASTAVPLSLSMSSKSTIFPPQPSARQACLPACLLFFPQASSPSLMHMLSPLPPSLSFSHHSSPAPGRPPRFHPQRSKPRRTHRQPPSPPCAKAEQSHPLLTCTNVSWQATWAPSSTTTRIGARHAGQSRG